MSVMEGEECNVLQDLYSYLEALETQPQKGEDGVQELQLLIISVPAVSVITLLTSCACLLLCLLLNIYIAINVIYTGKFKVS